MRYDQRRTGEGGFTLVETLISIFILGLITSAGGAMLITTFNGQRLIEAETSRVRSLDLALALMRQDMANAVSRRAERPGSLVGAQALYGGPPDRDGVVLGLVRAGWTNIDQAEDRSDLLAVEYILRDQSLVRRILLRPDAVRNTPVAERVLLTGVERLDVRFLVGEQVSAIWGLGSGGEVQMPDAVEFTVRLQERGDLVQRFLVGARP